MITKIFVPMTGELLEEDLKRILTLRKELKEKQIISWIIYINENGDNN